MPSIQDIDSFKNLVSKLGKEQEIRKELGMPELQIAPPSNELPEDLADLLGGMPTLDGATGSGEDEFGFGPSAEEDDLLKGLFDDPISDGSEESGDGLPNLDDFLGLSGPVEDLEPDDGALGEGLKTESDDFMSDFLGTLGKEDDLSNDDDKDIVNGIEKDNEIETENLEEPDLDDLLGSLGFPNESSGLPEKEIPSFEDENFTEDLSPVTASPQDAVEDFEPLDDLDAVEELDPIEDFDSVEELEEFSDFEDGDMAGDADDLANLFPPTGNQGKGLPSDEDIQFNPSSFGGGDDFNLSDDYDIPNLDDSLLDDGFAGLAGAASHADVDAYDTDAMGEEFAIGDFGATFGLNLNDDLNQESLNPAMSVDKQIEEAQKAISVTDEEFATLQSNLGKYPLNLKLDIEVALGETELSHEDTQKLIKQLIGGLGVKAMALLVGKLLGKTIKIPPGYEKGTGDDLEAKQGSLAYNLAITVGPVLRNSVILSAVAALLILLAWFYIYIPMRAEENYRTGYALVQAMEPEKGEPFFALGWNDWPSEDWVFKYADQYKDLGNYEGARQKYRMLLEPAIDDRSFSLTKGQEIFTRYHRKALLEYADLESRFGFNGLDPVAHFAKADSLLMEILSRSMYDRAALLARGDNATRWARKEAARMEDANRAYSVYLQRYGYDGPITYRLIQHFMMREDQVGHDEVLRLKNLVLQNGGLEANAAVLASLSGWLIDRHEKQLRERDQVTIRPISLEEEYGAPPPDVASQAKPIDYYGDVRALLMLALEADATLPDVHYQLARMFRFISNDKEEEKALAAAESLFRTLSAGAMAEFDREAQRVDTLGRMAEVFWRRNEPLQAEKYFLEALRYYEDALNLGRLAPTPHLARLYEGLGDIYYLESQNWSEALKLYQKGYGQYHQNPGLVFKMGVIQFSQGDYKRAVERFYQVEKEPGLRQHPNVLYSMANSLFRSENYYGAIGYYEEVLSYFQSRRRNAIELIPELDPTQKDLLENIYKVMNNLALALFRGPAGEREDSPHFGRAFALLTEAYILYQDMNRDIDDRSRSLREDQISLNLRDIQSPSRDNRLDIYSSLPITLDDSSF